MIATWYMAPMKNYSYLFIVFAFSATFKASADVSIADTNFSIYEYSNAQDLKTELEDPQRFTMIVDRSALFFKRLPERLTYRVEGDSLVLSGNFELLPKNAVIGEKYNRAAPGKTPNYGVHSKTCRISGALLKSIGLSAQALADTNLPAGLTIDCSLRTGSIEALRLKITRFWEAKDEARSAMPTIALNAIRGLSSGQQQENYVLRDRPYYGQASRIHFPIRDSIHYLELSAQFGIWGTPDSYAMIMSTGIENKSLSVICLLNNLESSNNGRIAIASLLRSSKAGGFAGCPVNRHEEVPYAPSYGLDMYHADANKFTFAE